MLLAWVSALFITSPGLCHLALLPLEVSQNTSLFQIFVVYPPAGVSVHRHWPASLSTSKSNVSVDLFVVVFLKLKKNHPVGFSSV